MPMLKWEAARASLVPPCLIVIDVLFTVTRVWRVGIKNDRTVQSKNTVAEKAAHTTLTRFCKWNNYTTVAVQIDISSITFQSKQYAWP